MDTTTQRHGPAHDQQPPAPDGLSQGQALPSIASLTAMTGGVPGQEQPIIRPRQHSEVIEARDSGNWSITQSKHSSVTSNNMGLQIHHILNPGDSPSRNSVPDTPSSARYPSYASSTLPSLNHGFDNRGSIDAGSTQDSRRSSIDSRVHGQMSSLALNGPTSPYAHSENPSRASLVSNLQQQRGITNAEQRPNGTSPLSPLGPRSWSGARGNHPPRRAPVINPNPRSVSGAPDPMAASPTKGYAWAFPGNDDAERPHVRRGSSSGESSTERTMSRQNSYATSINSSIYTTDSNLPNGQRRFGEEDVTTTHHHSLHHRALTNLQSADQASTPNSGNYSRTPELRAMHKLAERKRRSEMKNLFDDLNSILPNSPGSKSSKWEILSKAIEFIKSFKSNMDASRTEIVRLREYQRRCEEDNQALRNELVTVWQRLRTADPNNAHVYGPMTNALAQDPSQMQAPNNNILPPLQQQQQQQQSPQPPPPHAQPQQWGPPAPSAMQGIEFGGMRPYEHSHR